ncbi:MAG TPA: ClbS/DfsB family four-helix bundle protein [Pirellulaceae bacterium]|nr:ClbS/DfsB family four-helix bundle protein [Pirellulaceae bacterium]HMO92583.1 ClbS/DfsB family four-helix bundle protein [Pirellulaceae bacterium]HMP71462.1 ClbS/DfsB family four-helix bundle protein [Pirellulaceae bacterium]
MAECEQSDPPKSPFGRKFESTFFGGDWVIAVVMSSNFMPRPSNKNDLLSAAEATYDQLLELLSAFSRDQRSGEFSFPHRDRCIRDVLAHLHEWHVLFLNWYSEGMNGRIPPMPATGYTWKDTPELNAALRDKHQRTSLKHIRSSLQETHIQLLQLINTHTNTELFEKRRYSWTGSTSLGSYLTSATSAHYNWAVKLLRRYKRLSE